MGESEDSGGSLIYVGKRFDSYEEVSEFIAAYEAKSRQKFWKRSSRSVEAARKFLRRPLNESIKYYELQYSCVHGGLEFKTRSKGLRQKRTYKIDCPARIKIRATMDGNHLEIKSFVGGHRGHDELKSQKNDSPTPPAKKKKTDDPPVIEEDSMSDSDDENEIQVFTKAQIHPTLECLKTTLDAHGMTLYNKANELIGIYLMTKTMDRSLAAWHDVIYVWTIPGWIKENFSVIVISIKDSNGDSEIVGVGFVKEEDKLALNWLFKTIRDEIDRQKLKVKYIFGEKHLVETYLKQLFPSAVSFVSLHSSLRLFLCILESEGFLVAKKELYMDYFKKMVYAKSSGEYKTVYNSFCKAAPMSMVDYFVEDWGHNIKDWTLFNMVSGGTLIDDNEAVPLDLTLRKIVPQDLSLLTYIKHLFKWINSQKSEHQFKASTYVLKTPATLPESASCVEKYSKHLTTYAFTFVSHQINASKDITVLDKVDNMHITQEDGVMKPATAESCDCKDWRSMMLPCRHIFAVRKASKMNFFSPDLCNRRWTKSFYIENRLNPQDIKNLSEDKQDKTEDSEAFQVDENVRQAVAVTDKLLNTLCTFHGPELKEKVKLLEEIQSSWSSQINVKIIPINPKKTLTPDTTTTRRVYKVPPNSESPKLLKNQQMQSKIIKIDLSHYGKTNVPLKFGLKPKQEQIRMIIEWIAKKNEELNVGNGLLDVDNIETNPKLIQHSILNESVDLELVRSRLTPEAFNKLLTVINEKRENEFWLCFICEAQLEDNCVLCASCLLWFHPKCVGMVNPQKRKVWFCYNCLQNCHDVKK